MKTVLPLVLVCVSFFLPAQADEKDETARAAWLAQVPANLQKDPAFAFVQEDPALPRVLLIGDSISIGYTPGVREALRGKANLLRIPANGSSTHEGLENLDRWLGPGPWAVIHFNWGLHDLKHWKNGHMDLSAPVVTPLDEYEKNLRTLVTRLQATKAKLVWATTTPVPEGSAGREAHAETAYNEVAARVMADMGVVIDDLHATVLPELSTLQLPNNVHYRPEGSRRLAVHVASEISAALPSHP